MIQYTKLVILEEGKEVILEKIKEIILTPPDQDLDQERKEMNHQIAPKRIKRQKETEADQNQKKRQNLKIEAKKEKKKKDLPQ